ncbi:N-acetylmuramoyl-L-alanine amidase [Terribacillus aidingensis]|uniref:N-acetylmuramoyl-L-alanine amidase n=1 Tax=Terribacillus aidingensis TaxID=586416 RepID=A0A285MY67_9BACI|nr:N-acetylmuramoyl-L-alanine amidase [Terribacillus aidingensis]SNZ02160.1 N-acetylmuramoyl-L-alanine amidase [Terribacillus aidingensis]
MVKIYVDPGHGGSDPGATANGLQEKNVTLAIGASIRDILQLEYENAEVRMSRTGDTFPSLSQRTNDANAWGADFFLSIHVNAGGGTGYEDYIYPSLSDRSETAVARASIHEEVMKLIDMRDRGMKEANFHVLRETAMPAVLTENGFIDNSADAAKMKNNGWIQNVARGHVNGLERALGLRKKANSTFLIRVKAQSLYYYDAPDWDARAGVVSQGEVFTVVETLTVDGATMYKLKSGNYITANPQYVEIV